MNDSPEKSEVNTEMSHKMYFNKLHLTRMRKFDELRMGEINLSNINKIYVSNL